MPQYVYKFGLSLLERFRKQILSFQIPKSWSEKEKRRPWRFGWNVWTACKEDDLGNGMEGSRAEKDSKGSGREKRDQEVYTFEGTQPLTEQNPNSLALESRAFTPQTQGPSQLHSPRCPFPPSWIPIVLCRQGLPGAPSQSPNTLTHHAVWKILSLLHLPKS